MADQIPRLDRALNILGVKPLIAAIQTETRIGFWHCSRAQASK
jgi:hypothetical protein